MEDEDGQSVLKKEIDSSKTSDPSNDNNSVQNNIVNRYDPLKLKSSLLKLNSGMPEESDGLGDSKEPQESSPSAEKKVNGELPESGNCVAKENGSNVEAEEEEEEEEMAPLSIGVDDLVDERKGEQTKQAEPALKRKLESQSNYQESSSSDDDSHSSSPVEFRGFKKRMIAKAEKSLLRQRQISESKNCSLLAGAAAEKSAPVENTKVLRSSVSKLGASDKEKSKNQLTEYAQYLGLQPTVKFKCYRCGEKNFQSMGSLNAHQTNCNKSGGPPGQSVLSKPPPMTPQIESNPSTNFRITRKVYLCSACGTYYENWKLFLHMRDVHKRHICLFCLGMFAIAEKLAEHLFLKHNVVDKKCKSQEEFFNMFIGSCYLTCCTCERMFTERDDFFDHQCNETTVTSSSICLREPAQQTATSHLQACSDQRNIIVNKLSQPQAATCSSILINQSSSSSSATGSIVHAKRLLNVPFLVREEWAGKSLTPALPRTPSAPFVPGSASDSEFIDASNFCHVDINEARAESPRKTSKPTRKSSLKKIFADITITLDSDSSDETDKIKRIRSVIGTEEQPINTADSKSISKEVEDVIAPSDKSENNETMENLNETSTVSRDEEKEVNSDSVENKPDEEIRDTDVDKREQSPASVVSENEKATDDEKSDVNPTTDDTTAPEVADVLHSSSENEENTSDEKIEKLQTKEVVSESETCRNDDDSPTTKDDADKNEPASQENLETEHDVNLSDRLEGKETSESQRESNENNEEEEKDSPSKEEKMDTESIDDAEDDGKKSPAPLDMEIERNTEDKKSEDVNETSEGITAPEADSPNVSHSCSENDESSFDKKEEDVPINESPNESDPTKIDGADKDSSYSDNCSKMASKSSPSGSEEKIAKNDDTDVEDESLDNQEQEPVKMDTNEEQPGEKQENGVSDSQQHPSENNTHDNEDNKSYDSDDSDKLSLIVSEASLHEDNSRSDNDEENKTDSKSNIDNAVHFESDSQAHTNQSEEFLNCKDDDSIAVNPESQKSDSVVGINDTNLRFGGENLQIASEEVMAMALTLEDKMESLSAQSVIKECIRTSCTTCGYCSHAVKIGVNGKQLALHLLAEHRYKPVKNETVEDVIERLKNSLDELQDVWFNTDSYDSSDKSCFIPYDRTYECFQCNFVTKSHKDLYAHKRKVHQKTILYCSMCKANFYSYSELLCHMCPGIYVSKDIQFRCCFCDMDRIPSAFRLMVHLRKSHHTCDICLEIAGDQQKLSTHMWKHKLHHLCYRCGIAYRNKPDITKHLFWKHGTESVLCKKCLQKKWPHVYHFCIPPTVFICDECNLSFSRAVALKVHKRIHAGDYPYTCSQCSQKFVARKILAKHENTHKEAPANEESKIDEVSTVTENCDKCEDRMETDDQPNEKKEFEQVKSDVQESVAVKKPEQSEEHLSKSHKKKNKKDKDKKNKPVVDVYDLPPLNLSSESDDSDDEKKPTKTNDNRTSASVTSPPVSLPMESSSEPTLKSSEKVDVETEEQKEEHAPNTDSSVPTEPPEPLNSNEDNFQAPPIVDGIWDNFHSYKAEQEKRESSDPNCKPARLPYPLSAMPDSVSTCIILGDHDYCFVEKSEEKCVEETKTDSLESKPVPREHSSSIDHDYCTSNNNIDKGSNLNASENGPSVSQGHQESKSPSTVTPKKKQKSPKKSEKHNSSSSSDSSSDSDSSSCSNSNCSCCSTGSGSSSSSSSDSDSSSSEGKRQGVGKRERKKEKTKSKKKEEAASMSVPATVAAQDEEPVVDLQVEHEEPPIKESDLDTNESSTDEDFYDQYPQRHANQMLAEKRNQLMVLATVAPVNNGISSPPPAQVVTEETPPTPPVSAPPVVQSPSPPPPAAVEASPPPRHTPNIKRVRAKKRRKGGQTKSQTSPATPSSTVVYEAQPSTSFSQPTARTITDQVQYTSPSTPVSNNQNSAKSGGRRRELSAETDSSKRLSKRRRVPNKFYGYSSDEEEEEQQQQLQQQTLQFHRPAASPAVSKWRKVEQPAAVASSSLSPRSPPDYSGCYQPKVGRPSLKSHQEDTMRYTEAAPTRRPPAVVSSSAGGSSSNSSSSSSGSDSDSEPDPIAPPPAVVVNPASEKDEKLYCYCQCPYDEVSEMIACDGTDCTIEWFHFECVGIMVPPKGKWYCPDCKRRKNLL